jgi:hypothetical protein
MPVQTTYPTVPVAGIAGQLLDALNDGRNIASMFNTEATDMIPYGYGVEQVSLTGDGYDGTRERHQGVKLPNSITDSLFGLLAHSHSTVDSLTSGGLDGLIPGASCNILRRGRILVKPEAASGVVAGARLYVRAIAGGGYTKGALRGSADGINTMDCTNQGVWLTAPDADGFAELEIDCVSKGGI